MFPDLATSATMVAVGAGFFVFLIETRLGTKAVRISSDIL